MCLLKPSVCTGACPLQVNTPQHSSKQHTFATCAGATQPWCKGDTAPGATGIQFSEQGGYNPWGRGDTVFQARDTQHLQQGGHNPWSIKIISHRNPPWYFYCCYCHRNANHAAAAAAAWHPELNKTLRIERTPELRKPAQHDSNGRYCRTHTLHRKSCCCHITLC